MNPKKWPAWQIVTFAVLLVALSVTTMTPVMLLLSSAALEIVGVWTITTWAMNWAKKKDDTRRAGILTKRTEDTIKEIIPEGAAPA